MPIYLYQCGSCGLRFEKMQRMSEGPLTECPECEGQLHRVIQPVGIIFKGSGFYVTDNRQGSSPTLAPAKDKDKDGDKPQAETKAADSGDSKEIKPAETKAAETKTKTAD